MLFYKVSNFGCITYLGKGKTMKKTMLLAMALSTVALNANKSLKTVQRLLEEKNYQEAVNAMPRSVSDADQTNAILRLYALSLQIEILPESQEKELLKNDIQRLIRSVPHQAQTLMQTIIDHANSEKINTLLSNWHKADQENIRLRALLRQTQEETRKLLSDIEDELLGFVKVDYLTEQNPTSLNEK